MPDAWRIYLSYFNLLVHEILFYIFDTQKREKAQWRRESVKTYSVNTKFLYPGFKVDPDEKMFDKVTQSAKVTFPQHLVKEDKLRKKFN